ncbi:hypothetical protein PN471_12760 [Aphanizomenon sp. CS-733/32]|uniref:arginine synthesis PII-interacting regulator PirA n=1 Tax=Aphanizomenon sp. CS-733/32 TaxID=3021715 RepID=UPI0023307261|nr:hypothetical protein [Aphanizomenon sp. CS-733/32]MDB9309482.1 hypothetical protein [Aphanizomenon sp. CS-733/32]
MNKRRVDLAKESSIKHQENMRKTLEHRLQAARTDEDKNLLRQLEAEMTKYSENFEPPGVKANFLGFLHNFKTILAPNRAK